MISGEIGIRKPAPEIYALAAERLGRAPERCVFVDDLAGNLKPARAIGMATVLHRDAEHDARGARGAPRRQPALIATTPASVSAMPTPCVRLTCSESTNRASTTVTAG